MGALLELVTAEYLPYLEANACAFAAGDARVRYALRGVAFDEPTKPYRVWCRDRLQRALVALPGSERATVERVVAALDALARLALPSPKQAESVIPALPIPSAARRAPVDSWWRPARGSR